MVTSQHHSEKCGLVERFVGTNLNQSKEQTAVKLSWTLDIHQHDNVAMQVEGPSMDGSLNYAFAFFCVAGHDKSLGLKIFLLGLFVRPKTLFLF